LIVNFDIVTGHIIAPTCGDTRTEADFLAHIHATIQSDLSSANAGQPLFGVIAMKQKSRRRKPTAQEQSNESL
jgi:hypothetical protein